jgi:hypothetical protein
LFYSAGMAFHYVLYFCFILFSEVFHIVDYFFFNIVNYLTLIHLSLCLWWSLFQFAISLGLLWFHLFVFVFSHIL